MTFLQPTVMNPKSSTDYKKTTYEFKSKYIHPIDQIDFHKQAREVIYSTMTNKAMSVQKLKNTLENIRGQLNLEKASSQAKDNKIKSLEELVMEVGYDPKNIKVSEELIKKKNAYIVALKKQMKFPPAEHPQAKEVLQNEGQKDEMMNLIIQLTTQLKEMKNKMDKLVQEKNTSMEAIPVTTIPIVTTIAPSCSYYSSSFYFSSSSGYINFNISNYIINIFNNNNNSSQ